jgi:MFS family permease
MQKAIPPPEPRKAALAFIFSIVLLDVIALGIIIPVLPKLVESMLGGDTPRAGELYGLFGTAWALMQFVFSPLLGALSDRFGRRPVLLISMLGLGLDYILMALAPTLAWLFVGPTLLEGVTPEMSVFREEVFGPVLSMLRPSTLEEAIQIMNQLPYGNGATIFTSSGHHARQFAREMKCGMIGVNVGVPAPMASTVE